MLWPSPRRRSTRGRRPRTQGREQVARDLRRTDAASVTFRRTQQSSTAYSQCYAIEANRRRAAFYIDLVLAIAALVLTTLTVAESWSPDPWTSSTDGYPSLRVPGARPARDRADRDKRHRRESQHPGAVRSVLLKDSSWPQHWNRLLAGEPIPTRTIKQLAAANQNQMFTADYWVNTDGLPDNDAALFRIEQTAAWGSRRTSPVRQAQSSTGDGRSTRGRRRCTAPRREHAGDSGRPLRHRPVPRWTHPAPETTTHSPSVERFSNATSERCSTPNVPEAKPTFAQLKTRSTAYGSNTVGFRPSSTTETQNTTA